MGSKDAEGAAQETLKRAFEHPLSRGALAYYVQGPSGYGEPPAWGLADLLAWLHGVLRRVVQEERHARASHWRERSADDGRLPEVVDAAADQLELLIDTQLRTIVRECLSTLSPEYRRVLTLRYWDGLKYSQIADRHGINENTVATRLARGTAALSRCVLERMRRIEHGARARGQRA